MAERNITNDRLEDIKGILALAFRSELAAARQQILADPVQKELLGRTDGRWQPSGPLQRAVAESCEVGVRTVRDDIAELVGLGLLRAEGEGKARQLRASGLVLP